MKYINKFIKWHNTPLEFNNGHRLLITFLVLDVITHLLLLH